MKGISQQVIFVTDISILIFSQNRLNFIFSSCLTSLNPFLRHMINDQDLIWLLQKNVSSYVLRSFSMETTIVLLFLNYQHSVISPSTPWWSLYAYQRHKLDLQKLLPLKNWWPPFWPASRCKQNSFKSTGSGSEVGPALKKKGGGRELC